MNDTKEVARREPQSTQPQPAAQAQGRQEQQPALLPAVDIVEDGHGITLRADLPGVSRERLVVKVEGDQLLIEGAAAVPVPEQIELVHSELRYPLFRRAFTLSRELDTNGIQANLKDGVLLLTIPKAEEAKPRRIDVRIA